MQKSLRLKTFINNYTKLIISVLILIIVLLFSWWSNPSLIPTINPGDSPGYIVLAEDFTHPITEIRPFFYSLIIRICMNISESNWEILLSVFQILLHSVISVLIFHLYLKYNFKIFISFILTLIIGFNPSLIYWSTYLMSDFLLAVLTTLAWLFSIIFIQKNKNKKNITFLILMGIFSGLAVVTKPIAILGIVPLLFTYIILSKRTLYMLRTILIILIINYSFHFSWEMYKKYNDPNTTFELLNSVGISFNFAALRGGLIDYAQGTPLYNRIEEKGLLQTARNFKVDVSYTMDGDPEFWKFNKSFSWEIKRDKEFAKKILKNAPLKLFIIQISNWHAFFTKRCFGPGDGSFPFMPDLIRYIYNVGYALLYRPLLLIMLLLSFIILWKKRLLTLLISSSSMLLYASLAIALLAPHAGEFPRYRVWVEYIMWFCALMPIGFIIQNLYEKLNNKLI